MIGIFTSYSDTNFSSRVPIIIQRAKHKGFKHGPLKSAYNNFMYDVQVLGYFMTRRSIVKGAMKFSWLKRTYVIGIPRRRIKPQYGTIDTELLLLIT